MMTWLVNVKQQAITWINVDKIYGIIWCRSATVSHWVIYHFVCIEQIALSVSYFFSMILYISSNLSKAITKVVDALPLSDV